MESAKYQFGDKDIRELEVRTLGTGEGIPFSLDELRKVEVTTFGESTIVNVDILDVYTLLRMGQSSVVKHNDRVGAMIYKHLGPSLFLEEQDVRPDLTSVEIKAPEYMPTSRDIRQLFSETVTTVDFSTFLSTWGMTTTSSSSQLSLEEIEQTGFCFLCLLQRISHHESTSAKVFVQSSSMYNTAKRLLPMLNKELFVYMVELATTNGVFATVQPGCRWVVDTIVMLLWARNSSVGQPVHGLFGFLLVGLIGFQFASLNAMASVSTALQMGWIELLANMAIVSARDMAEALDKKAEFLKNFTRPWYLLCHNMRQGFVHDFSLAKFGPVAWISIYASQLIKNLQADMNIPGLPHYTANEIIRLKSIAERIVNTRRLLLTQSIRVTLPDGTVINDMVSEKPPMHPTAPADPGWA